ncbi:unnamed protein product [Penicillium discolor]
MNYEKKASRGQYKKKTGYGTIIALQAIRRSDPQCRLSDLAVHRCPANPPNPHTTMPPSASTNGASSTPDALESDLLVKLSASSALEDLQENLLGSLHRLGWTDKVTTLATELLRAGRCETFDDVMAAVLASAEGRTHPALGAKIANGETTNGTKETNGVKKGNKVKDHPHPYDPLKYIEEIDIRIPETVVDEGVRGLKDIIREVADLEGESAPNGDKK